uniref:Telomeric repeat-binding factor 2-interacting protein 1 n=1 Tax=Gouania willdenowi TaxID=441366 RepID=A0A8C5NCF3_GOUWI
MKIQSLQLPKAYEPNCKTHSVLFMTVDGDPMSFYLRPGPIKRRYQPLITAGGGTLCNVQQPGAILLIDPEEKTSIPESTYIQDCVEKNEQLDPESYRLNPEVIQRRSSRHSSKDISPRPSGEGRRRSSRGNKKGDRHV